MSIKTKILRQRIKNCLTKSRFIKSYEKKKGILIIFLLIINIYIWNDIINDLDSWEIKIEQVSSGATVSAFAYEAQKFEEDEVVIKYNLPQILDKIRMLESSGGKNDSCLARGKINGYGYMQSKEYWKCFDSNEEVRGLVENWLVEHLGEKEMTLEQALCRYNQGGTDINCEYYKNFQLLQ